MIRIRTGREEGRSENPKGILAQSPGWRRAYPGNAWGSNYNPNGVVAGSPRVFVREPQDGLQVGGPFSLSHRMGEGRGEGLFSKSVVYPNTRTVSQKWAVLDRAGAGLDARAHCSSEVLAER